MYSSCKEVNTTTKLEGHWQIIEYDYKQPDDRSKNKYINNSIGFRANGTVALPYKDASNRESRAPWIALEKSSDADLTILIKSRLDIIYNDKFKVNFYMEDGFYHAVMESDKVAIELRKIF